MFQPFRIIVLSFITGITVYRNIGQTENSHTMSKKKLSQTPTDHKPVWRELSDFVLNWTIFDSNFELASQNILGCHQFLEDFIYSNAIHS